MARTWLSITVEPVEGRGETFWPRPGRTFAAARTHSFAQFADAIEDAFARWDRAHLMAFELTDGTRLERPDPTWDESDAQDATRTRLSRLRPGEQFTYEFDFGDSWTHLCTVDEQRVDPDEVLGTVPRPSDALLGLGRHPRPVRPPLGRRRGRTRDAT